MDRGRTKPSGTAPVGRPSSITRDLSQRTAALEAFASGQLDVVDTLLHNIGNAMNSVSVGIGTLCAELRRGVTQRLRAVAEAISRQGDGIGEWLRNDPQGRKAVTVPDGAGA